EIRTPIRVQRQTRLLPTRNPLPLVSTEPRPRKRPLRSPPHPPAAVELRLSDDPHRLVGSSAVRIP
ncbi:hypothetical protein EJB05_42840, partial [Eragrostis curvula]